MDDKSPEDVQLYLSELATRLKKCLGQELIGLYLFGSASYNAYEPGTSDLDVQAVVEKPLSPLRKHEIAHNISAHELPCPARKLEFVVYSADAIKPATRNPQFELNFNTGPYNPDYVCLDPSQESSHWFLLDIAIGRETGRALHGPPPNEAFAPVPRQWVLEAIIDCLQWHTLNEPNSSNCILNACRAWRYVVTSTFGSKLDGAEWAMTQDNSLSIVSDAIIARGTGEKLCRSQTRALVDVVLKAAHDSLVPMSLSEYGPGTGVPES
ncbi:streptomycin 3''-adenylyltransferase [Stachybotrys elegans]|uniref:Streptomycin 3''-adenylyltransferase n=1 Tax=Stachybotrys elegans TaxID=80388 RepID=A0A8K0WLL8_9HYPO|nr:streptomycin 3''-adenylyltransferase [Stachybotrys elegans]